MLTCLLRLDRNDFSLRFSLVDGKKPTNYLIDHHVTNHLTTYHMTHSARIRRLQTTSLLGIDNKGYKAEMKLGRANKNNSK